MTLTVFDHEIVINLSLGRAILVSCLLPPPLLHRIWLVEIGALTGVVQAIGSLCAEHPLVDRHITIGLLLLICLDLNQTVLNVLMKVPLRT